MEQRRYAEVTRRAFHRAWSHFEQYCEESGQPFPSRKDGVAYLDADGLMGRCRVESLRIRKRATLCLFDLEEGGEFPRSYGNERIKTPECFVAVREKYTEWLEPRGLHPKTVYAKRHLAKKFLHFLDSFGVKAIEGLQSRHVYAYLAEFDDCTSMAKSAHLFFLREFLNFLVDSYSLDPAIGGLFPVILVNRNDVMPSFFTADEMKAALGTLDGSGRNPLRDRAIVLLAMQLGMRAGDIRELLCGHIDWRLGKISYVQQKTDRPINLPLPEECKYAILDYMKNERGQSDDPHVFVCIHAPHRSYSEYYTFHSVIARCYERAGIDTAGKHHGLHSVRHSVAINMLLADTPYPVIAGVLGHGNANTTKMYLRADVEHLRPLSLEVPNA
jgi:integrase